MTEDFGGAKIAVLSGDAVVALLRDDMPGIAWPGRWDLPGGGREGDEPPHRTALRELNEETGLIVDPARIHFARAFGRAWFFAVRLDGLSNGDLTLGDEGQALRLMPVTEFLSRPDAIPHFQDRLRDALAG